MAMGLMRCIVDVEFFEIADDDPARVMIMRQIARITTRLLRWCKHLTIRLLVAPAQINVLSLLLNQNTGRLNKAINEAGVTQLNAHLKIDKLIRFSHAKHLLQKSHEMYAAIVSEK